ncbi:MAG: hypothetical protein OEZ55_11995 [Nitrospinota bacterium]|nr:hypothetical protein [Nitrospinota bacterium]MDH5757375.1 hypothetical protein [Nitrospinota bacterium]
MNSERVSLYLCVGLLYLSFLGFAIYFVNLPWIALAFYALFPTAILLLAFTTMLFIGRVSTKQKYLTWLLIGASLAVVFAILPVRSFLDHMAMEAAFRENHVKGCISSLLEREPQSDPASLHYFCDCVFDQMTQSYSLAQLMELDRQLGSGNQSKEAESMARQIHDVASRKCTSQ